MFQILQRFSKHRTLHLPHICFETVPACCLKFVSFKPKLESQLSHFLKGRIQMSTFWSSFVHTEMCLLFSHQEGVRLQADGPQDYSCKMHLMTSVALTSTYFCVIICFTDCHICNAITYMGKFISLHSKRILKKKSLEAPCGPNEMWVWTAVRTRRLPANVPTKVHKHSSAYSARGHMRN